MQKESQQRNRRYKENQTVFLGKKKKKTNEVNEKKRSVDGCSGNRKESVNWKTEWELFNPNNREKIGLKKPKMNSTSATCVNTTKI